MAVFVFRVGLLTKVIKESGIFGRFHSLMVID
jgi:hypothetical protein